MNQRISLQAWLDQSDGSRADQLELFALINLGLLESLSAGILSAADSLQVFFHADNCLFVRKRLKNKDADEIMSRGVQLADVLDIVPADQAQREFHRELTKLRSSCLKLMEHKRKVA